MIKHRFNKAIRSMLFSDSLMLIATAMLGPLYAIFVEEIGGNLLDAGITFAVFSFVAGVVILISGALSDKVKEVELIIVVGYAVTAIGFFSYIFVDNMTSLMVAQVIVGIGTAVRAPAFDALFSEHLDKHKEGIEWGAWDSLFYFASAFGAVVGGYFASRFGFDYIFIVMATLCAISAVYIYLLPRKLL